MIFNLFYSKTNENLSSALDYAALSNTNWILLRIFFFFMNEISNLKKKTHNSIKIYFQKLVSASGNVCKFHCVAFYAIFWNYTHLHKFKNTRISDNIFPAITDLCHSCHWMLLCVLVNERWKLQKYSMYYKNNRKHVVAHFSDFNMFEVL